LLPSTGNYRPVSLTLNIAKVFDKIMKFKLVEFLEVNEVLPPSQHGFRAHFIMVTQMIERIEQAIEGLESH
jgi:hypothetical protein